MTKNYYRSEYSDKQWKALIDKATELGCQITYSKYGNIVTIDSTDRERRTRQAERYTKDMIYGSLNLISVELKQENSNGK